LVDEARGLRSLLEIEMNKETFLTILAIKLPTESSTTITAAKPDIFQKKKLLKDCQSIIQGIWIKIP